MELKRLQRDYTYTCVDMDNGWTIERSVDRAGRTKNPFDQLLPDSSSYRIIIGLIGVDDPPSPHRRSRLVSVRLKARRSRFRSH